MKSTHKIEKMLSSSTANIQSLTRKPLLKYLNKLASTSFNFFFKAEVIQEYGKMLIQILVLFFIAEN